MSRTNVESIAERAARFEDIDFDRYNRLKAKYGELDLSQQYENDLTNHLQLQRYLRLNDLNNSANNNGISLLNYQDHMNIKTIPSNCNSFYECIIVLIDTKVFFFLNNKK